MMMSWPLLDRPITWDEESVPLLVVENPKALRRLLETMQGEACSGDGDVVFSDGIKPFDAAKAVELITDPLSLDFSAKQLATKLTQAAMETGEDFSERLYEITTMLNDVASQIALNMDYDVTFSELDNFTELLKMMKFHPDAEDLPLHERLMEYMRLSRGLLGKKVFVVYGLFELLGAEEFDYLLAEVTGRKFNVLLVEAHQPEPTEHVQTVIVDKDLCILR